MSKYNPDIQQKPLNDTLTYSSYVNPWVNTHRAIDMPGIPDGADATKLAITTTNISIYSNDMRIGFVQSFNVSESRDITPIQELGTEGVVQMVPGNTRGGQIQLQRVALYNSDIWNALGLTPTGLFTDRDIPSPVKSVGTAYGKSNQMIYGSAFKRTDSGTYGNPFRTLKDQRVPLEIRVHTILPNKNEETYLAEIYYDVWISNYQKTIQAQQVWVSEQVTAEYSDMASEVFSDGDANFMNTEWNKEYKLPDSHPAARK